MKAHLGVIASFTIMGWSTLAPAGVTFTLQRDQERSVFYVEGNKMTIESLSDGGRPAHLMIYDGDQQKMLVVDAEKKTYSEMTPQNIKAATNSMQQQLEAATAKMSPEDRKKYDELMANLPPEQRRAMGAPTDRAAQKPKAPEIKWERTGAKQTVLGYPCEGFKELKNGEPHAEGCYIPWSAGAVTKADLAPTLKMEEFFKQSGAITAERQIGVFAQLEQGPGFPAIWTSVDNKSREKHTVTSIQRGAVPTDKFRVPAGYTKTDAFKGGRP